MMATKKTNKKTLELRGGYMSKDSKISKTIEMLEDAFDILNKEYFESALSRSVITIQSTPKEYGHFLCNKIWNDSEESQAHEINLGAETLNREIESVIATLIHEMVHQYCSENKIKDTSRRNTCHNQNFKIEAEKRGLIINYDKKIGWSRTIPSEELKLFIQKNEIFRRITLHRITTPKEKKLVLVLESMFVLILIVSRM